MGNYFVYLHIFLFMQKRFSVILLKSAKDFIFGLDLKTQTKIYFVLDKASHINDPKLFKKLQNDIWEFRIQAKSLHIRLLAFWDKRNEEQTLVISTHGFIKKRRKLIKTKLIKPSMIENNILKINNMEKSKLEIFTLEQLKDESLGKIGTPQRDKYENELKLELLGEMIKQVRKDRNLTQEELGKLVGVQKAQISKLERSTKNARLDTIIKVFNALKAKVNFSVELYDGNLEMV